MNPFERTKVNPPLRKRNDFIRHKHLNYEKKENTSKALLKLDLILSKKRLPKIVAAVGKINAPQKFLQIEIGSDIESLGNIVLPANSLDFSAGLPSI